MSTIVMPEITTGTWTFDPSHSELGFSVRHLMVSKVKGRFSSFEGAITVAEDPLESSVNVSVDLSSIDTRDEKRDAHLRSPDFFETDAYPTMTFVSTAVRAEGDSYVVVGDLSIHGVTKPVEAHGRVQRRSHRPLGWQADRLLRRGRDQPEGDGHRHRHAARERRGGHR